MDEDHQCILGSPQFERPDSAEKDIKLMVQDRDYIGKIKELHTYLDKIPEHNWRKSKQLPFDLPGQYDQVKESVKPGCSPEVLKVALNSMSSLVNFLSRISSTPKLHASL